MQKEVDWAKAEVVQDAKVTEVAKVAVTAGLALT